MSPVQTLKHAERIDNRQREVLGNAKPTRSGCACITYRRAKDYSHGRQLLTAGARISESLPNHTAIRSQNALCERGSIVSTKCARRVNLVSKSREKDLAVSFELDLFPDILLAYAYNRSSSTTSCTKFCGRAGHVHLAILELGLVEDCDGLARHCATERVTKRTERWWWWSQKEKGVAYEPRVYRRARKQSRHERAHDMCEPAFEACGPARATVGRARAVGMTSFSIHHCPPANQLLPIIASSKVSMAYVRHVAKYLQLKLVRRHGQSNVYYSAGLVLLQ